MMRLITIIVMTSRAKKDNRAYRERLKGHRDCILTLFSPEGPAGNLLVSASADGVVREWDLTQTVPFVTLNLQRPAVGCQLSCYYFQGLFAYAGYSDGGLCAFNLEGGTLSYSLRGHEDVINQIDSDGVRLFSASHDCSVRAWNVETQTCLLIYKFTEPVSSICVARTAQRLYVGSWDRMLRTIDLQKNMVTNAMLASEDAIKAILASENYVFVAGCDPVIRAWHIESGDCRTFTGHRGWVIGLHIHKAHLYSYSDDRTIRVWSLESGRCVEEFRGHEDSVTCLTFAKDSLYSGSLDHSIRSWDLRDMLKRVEEREIMGQEELYSRKVEAYDSIMHAKGKRKGKGKGKKGKKGKKK
jgi:F-box and WD-40 domain protein 1/11/F-box/WD-40 domain protein 7